jgi:hypothetical protein
VTICPECGETNRERAMFCVNCGEMLLPQDAAAPFVQESVQAAPKIAPEPRHVPLQKIQSTPDVSVSNNDARSNFAPFPDDSEPPPPSQVETSAPFPSIPPEQAMEEAIPPEQAMEEATPPEMRGDVNVPFPEKPESGQDAGPLAEQALGQDHAVAPFPDIADEEPLSSSGPEPEDGALQNVAPFPEIQESDTNGGAGPVQEPEPAAKVVSETHSVPSTTPEAPHVSSDESKEPQLSDVGAARSGLPNLDHIATDADSADSKDIENAGILTDIEPPPPSRESVVVTIPAPVAWQSKGCEMCGFQNEPEAAYCGQCGTALAKPSTSAGKTRQVKLIQLAYHGGEVAQYDLDANGLVIHAPSGDLCSSNEYSIHSHAMFRLTQTDVILIPPSREGRVLARIPTNKPIPIDTGRAIRVGQQLLVFQATQSQPGVWGHLKRENPTTAPSTIVLDRQEMVVGRERGHIVFSDDPLISGTHMKFYEKDGKFFVHDLESTNGTFLQIMTRYHPKPGQVFIIGSKIYKIGSH